jgi:catechol 2,3-dioxygenase-like lactoylglutathione lyase family enzyme
MIKAIKFVSIPVRDQDAAITFYTQKLGFKLVTDQPFNHKQRWVEIGIPGAETKLVLFTMDGDEKRIGAFMNFAFVSDNVEKTYAELSARGVPFSTPPKKEPWGTFATFKDPDGNQFVIGTK